MLSVPGDRIEIPSNLSDKIKIYIQCVPTSQEYIAINGALYALGQAFLVSPPIHHSAQLNVFILDRDAVTITSSNPGCVGLQLNCALLFLHRWRDLHFDQTMMIATAAEEFCHFFWEIKDEILVLYKVRDLLHILAPGVPAIDSRIRRMQEERRRQYPAHR